MASVRQKITPFLWYDGQAEEAANFYISLFPDSKVLNVMRHGDQVVTVEFQLAGQRFVALNGGPQFKFTEAISLFVDCADQAEVDELWGKLTAGGGEESQCGWLKDRYGLSWQIIPRQLMEYLGHSDREAAGRATQAMLQMQKIDVETLRKAFEGR